MGEVVSTESIRYMVVCDHPEMNRRYFVADIDDDRPNGGPVHFQIYRSGMGTTVKAMNKRGSRRSIPFACGACTLYVELQETSLPDLLDKIAPHRDELFPMQTVPLEESPDLDTDQWYDVMFNSADPGPSTVVGTEQRYVVSLKRLCDINGELRARGRH